MAGARPVRRILDKLAERGDARDCPTKGILLASRANVAKAVELLVKCGGGDESQSLAVHYREERMLVCIMYINILVCLFIYSLIYTNVFLTKKNFGDWTYNFLNLGDTPSVIARSTRKKCNTHPFLIPLFRSHSLSRV